MGSAKSRLFDNRLVLNLAGYYTKVRNFQATIVDSTQAVALRGYLSNIPEVVVKGVEADATALIARGLSCAPPLPTRTANIPTTPLAPCPLEQQSAATTACNLTGKKLSGLLR